MSITFIWLYIYYTILLPDCGVGSLLENGAKEARRSVKIENGTLEQELYYSCDTKFQLYPRIQVKTCELNAEWFPDTVLTCIPGKIYFVVLHSLPGCGYLMETVT